MSTEKSNSIINPNHSHDDENHPATNFLFNNNSETSKNSLGAYSVADSAYDSLVCSPFSPIIISNSSKPNTTEYPDNLSNALESVSPFLETGETDEVFKMSLEQIYTDRNPGISTSNSIFRPISSDREINLNSIAKIRSFCNTQPNVALRQNVYSQSAKSQRSISTQTKFSLSSIGFYRPNSAPLQEGIEEELSEIETSAIESSNYQMPRNSTCHCIRSPMPDLIQPTVQRDNQLLISRLSLIADQIDRDLSPANTSMPRNPRQTRRFSTPSLSEITPGGSLFDLLFNIYHAFDHRPTRHRSATYSYNESDEEDRRNN